MLRLIQALLACVCLFANADNPSPYQTLNQQAQAQWLRLLGYDFTHPGDGHQSSAILSKDFFIHPRGHIDPDLELEASLQAFALPIIEPDQHSQCKYRGRYLWLRRHFPMESAPVVRCHEFEKWVGGTGEVESVSFVLVSGNLGNPASFYGHTLIKINPKKASAQSELNDSSVNFGAIVPDDASLPGYIWNTITGGYEGGFTHDQYHYHTHNYGERQLRDLWEYELDLSQEEATIIAGHAWELLGKKYRYYFLHRNCAFRMAHILELADGVDIVDSKAPWHIPQGLTQSLMSATRHQQALVKQVRHQPSRQSRLRARISGLTGTEYTAFKEKLASNKSAFDRRSELSADQKIAVLDALMDTYRYKVVIDEENKDHYERLYVDSLRQRYQLPAIPSKALDLQRMPPHTSRFPGRTALGLAHYSDDKTGLLLDFRPAYYDVLDADHGHLAFSELSMASASLEMRSNRALLRRFELVRVTHNPTNQTGLDDESQRSWAMGFGWYGLDPQCSGGCAVPTAWTEGGLGRELSDWGYVAMRAGIGVRENRLGRGHVYAYPKLQLIAKLGNRWRASLSTSQIESLDSSFSETQSELVLRKPLSRNSDMRFFWNDSFGESAGLSVGWYW